MPTECTPAALAEAGKCFTCLSPQQRDAIKTYLMAVRAGGSTDPDVLANASKCFECLSPLQRSAVQTYLLCQLANGGSGDCENLSGSGSPEGSVTPQFITQVYVDTNTGNVWQATGLTSADWDLIGQQLFLTFDGATQTEFINTIVLGANGQGWNGYKELVCYITSMSQTLSILGISGSDGLTAIKFPNLVSAAAINCPPTIGTISTLETVLFPKLETCGVFTCQTVGLTTIDLSSLITCSGLTITNTSDLLTALSLPALVTCSGALNTTNKTGLVDFSAPNWVPTNGQNITMTQCALSEISVNHILARAIASAGYVSGTINLSGGTSAAPTGQGITDKADLITRGCTVTTN